MIPTGQLHMVNTLTMKFPRLHRLALLSLILTGWGFNNVAAQAQQIVRPLDNGIDEGDNFGKNITMQSEWAAGGASTDRRDGLTNVGAVYVMRLVDDKWTFHTKLMPAQNRQASEMRFGHALAMHGDRLAVMSRVAATNTPAPMPARVKVSVFHLVGGNWNLEAEVVTPLIWSDKATLTLGDERLIVSSALNSGPQEPIIIYHQQGSGWQAQSFRRFHMGSAWSYQPSSLALEGSTLLIGYPDVGQVDEYRLIEGNWTFSRGVKAYDTYLGDGFGTCIKLVGGRALIGASEPVTYFNLGKSKAYLYEVGESDWTLLRSFGEDNTLKIEDDTDMSLSTTRVLVSQRNHLNAVTELQINADLPATWVLRSISLENYDKIPRTSIATFGEHALVGYDKQSASPYLDIGKMVALSGSPSLTLGKIVRPQLSHQQMSHYDGSSLDIQNERAVFCSRPSGGYESSVHIAERHEGIWRVVKSFDEPTLQDSNLRYGDQVKIDGNRIAITDPAFRRSNSERVTRVYIHEKTAEGWSDIPTITIEHPNAPTDSSKLVKIALSENHLAVGELDLNYSTSRSKTKVTVYRLQNEQAESIGEILREGGILTRGSIALAENSLVISDPSAASVGKSPGGEVLLYSLAGGTPRLVKTFRSKYSSKLAEFGTQVELNNNLLVVAGSSNGQPWIETFENVSGTWQSQMPLLQPRYMSENDLLTRMSLNGDHLLISRSNSDYQLYRKSEKGWIQLNQRPTVLSDRRPSAGAVIFGDTIAEPGTGVTFRSASQLAAADGVLAADRFIIIGTRVIELGELAVGVDTKVKLPLQNRGTQTLRISALNESASSSSPKSLKNLAFRPVSLAPGEATTVIVTLNPPTPGSYTTYLNLVHDRPELGDLSLGFTHTATSEISPPSFSQPEPPKLAILGEETLLAPLIQGTRGFTSQWTKDGKVMSGKTEPFLFFKKVRASDAGRYRLTVKRPGFPSQSVEVLLGVYALQNFHHSVSAQEPLKYHQPAWGPGIQVRWDAEESWAVRGTRTRTISLQNVSYLPFYPQAYLNAQVILGETTAVSTQASIEIQTQPVSVNFQDFFPVFMLGQEMDVSLYGLIEMGTAGLRLSGLPDGLVYSAENHRIEGTATTLGTYPVTFIVSQTGFPDRKFVRPLQVVNNQDQVVVSYGDGAGYTGLMSVPTFSENSASNPALLRIQLTRGKSLSGQFSMGTLKQRFSAKWVASAEDLAREAKVTLAPLQDYREITLNFIQRNSTVIEAVIQVTSNDPDLDALLDSKELWPEITKVGPTEKTFPGRYNFLMNSIGSSYPETSKAAGGLGIGFGTITLSRTMNSRVVGIMPDGSSLTYSSAIHSFPGSPKTWLLAIVSYRDNGGYVAGTLGWSGEATNDSTIAPLSGDLAITRPAVPRNRLYPDGFHSENFMVEGSRYFIPKATRSIPDPALGDTNATVTVLNGDEFSEQPLSAPLETSVKVHNDLRISVNGSNSQGLRMDVHQPTGFFTGKQTLNELIPGSETRRIKRDIRFRGMIVPDLHRGGGLFQIMQLPNPLADPPVTRDNALMQTGRVILK